MVADEAFTEVSDESVIESVKSGHATSPGRPPGPRTAALLAGKMLFIPLRGGRYATVGGIYKSFHKAGLQVLTRHGEFKGEQGTFMWAAPKPEAKP